MNTSELTSDTGEIINYYIYTPFGKTLLADEAVSNDFEFVGQFGIRNMGNDLTYMRNRFYMPSTGRFYSEDPIGFAGGDVSFYRYVGNDPVSWVDPEGTVLISSAVAAAYFYGPAVVAAGVTAAYKLTPYMPAILDFAEGFLPGPPSTKLGVYGAATKEILSNFAEPLQCVMDNMWDTTENCL